MELSEAYNYAKDIMQWALIPMGVYLYRLVKRIDNSITKDEAEKLFVKTEDLKIAIKECFADFVKDSLELKDKYVTMSHLSHREEVLTREMTRTFTEQTRRIEDAINQYNLQLSSLPDKVADLDKTMTILDNTLNSLKTSLNFVSDQLDAAGDIIDKNKQELSDKIHKIELNCARRNHD